MVKRNQLRYLWKQGDGVIQARDQVQKESVQGRTEEIKSKAKVISRFEIDVLET